jgi:C1A family cysteine protease
MPHFGWIPDAEEKKVKDWKAAPLLTKVSARPAAVSLRRLILSILNQLNLGSCVTNAGAQVVRAAVVKVLLAAGKSPEEAELLSRLFTYYYARAISPGNTQVDSGTQIRCFFDVIRKLGYCPETAWPYDTSKFATMPKPEAARQAIDQKISVGYYSIDSTGSKRIDDVCTALAGGNLVVFGTPVGNNFMSYTRGSLPLTPPGDIAGGHALTVAGYDATAPRVLFDICNSWGPGYGDGGYCTMDESYIAWDETRDLWIVEAMPDFSA